ncbi:MAG: stage V sporulation protein M [bacterium]
MRIHVIKVPKFLGSLIKGLLHVFHRGE